MKTDLIKLEVEYNGKLVGYLAQNNKDKVMFQYDEQWIQSGFSISPYSLPLKNEIFTSSKPCFNGLFGVFWDSLPDGWGELLVARLLQKKGINIESLSPLTRLSIIGSNGLGGLTYKPSQKLVEEEGEVDLDSISKEIELILNDNVDDGLDEVYRLGGSSGGARPKAHIKVDNEEWIVKFPCRIDPRNIGVQEYEANELARQCGINVSEHKLFDSKLCSGYFGSKRFDREDDKRIHVISLAALLETTHRIPNLDYGHLFDVVKTINADKSELYEVFRRMCFNVLYGNKDDHSKNFAFMYDERIGKYRLTPAYDITKTIDKYEHEMTVNGNGNPTEQDMLELAKMFGLSNKVCKEIIENTKKVLNIR